MISLKKFYLLLVKNKALKHFTFYSFKKKEIYSEIFVVLCVHSFYSHALNNDY